MRKSRQRRNRRVLLHPYIRIGRMSGFTSLNPKALIFILTVKRKSAIVKPRNIASSGSIKFHFGKEVKAEKDRNSTNENPKHQRYEKNTRRFDPREYSKTPVTAVRTDNTQLHSSRGIQHRRYDLRWKARCWRDSGCRCERKLNPVNRGFLAWHFNRSGDYGGTVPWSKEPRAG